MVTVDNKYTNILFLQSLTLLLLLSLLRNPSTIRLKASSSSFLCFLSLRMGKPFVSLFLTYLKCFCCFISPWKGTFIKGIGSRRFPFCSRTSESRLSGWISWSRLWKIHIRWRKWTLLNSILCRLHPPVKTLKTLIYVFYHLPIITNISSRFVARLVYYYHSL